MKSIDDIFISTRDINNTSYGLKLSDKSYLITQDISLPVIRKQHFQEVVANVFWGILPILESEKRNYSQEVYSLIRPDLSSRIEKFFDFLQTKRIRRENPPEIRDYLTCNASLIDISGLICSKVFERFGKNSQITLALYKDPEIDDEYLTIYVRQDPYDDDIMARIEEISSEFDEELADSSGWLLITTDFKTPLE